MNEGDWVHAGPRLQVAYVVSWLNEAQMKLGSTPGASGSFWDSIRDADVPLLSLAEVRGLGLGSIPAGPRFPSAAARLQTPRSQSSGSGTSGQTGPDRTHAAPRERPESEPTPCSVTSCLTEINRHWCYYYVITSSIQTAKQKQLMGGCVTLRWLSIGCPQNVYSRLLTFFTGRAVSSCLLIRQTSCHSLKTRLLTSDWPIALSIFSRGNVLII